MDSIHARVDRSDFWSRFFRTCGLTTVATGFLSLGLLQADMPERTMANLRIDDQGNQLVISWHFFYFLLPQKFILHEEQDQPIFLHTTDPRLLEKNLTEVALVALDVEINGRKVQPRLSQLTFFPNRSCIVTLSYPGQVRGNVEMRAPILQYLPSGFVLNVSIFSSTGTKGAFFGRQFPPVIHFRQGNVPRSPEKPFFSKDVVAEFGAGWVNYNWILTCAVLLLMRQPKLIVALITSIVIFWILLCFATAVFDDKLPYKIPQVVLCLPTVLLCIICINYQERFILAASVTVIGGLLNACYDIEQIPLSVAAQTVNSLVGLSLGFVGGIALVLLVLVPLWWECKKYPGFQESWAPRISWVIAGLAVFLPLQKWIGG